MSVDLVGSIISLFESKMGLRSDSFKPRIWKGFIAKRMDALGVKDEEEYYKLLLHSNQEFLTLAELAVVPETFFFREPAALEHAARIVQTKGAGRCVRILSVACSSGEEPYSLVMLLEGLSVPRSYYHIDAVDISAAAIAAALKGEYRPNSFRGKSLVETDQFFDKVDRHFVLKNEIKKSVTFLTGNVVDDKFMQGYEKYDIIFCRNLFIYLSPRAQVAVLNKLASLLARDGALYIGATEAETVRRNGWEPLGPPELCCFIPARLESPKHHLVRQVMARKDIPAAPVLPSATPAIGQLSNLLDEASRLANQGKYAEALEICRQYIKHEGKIKAQAYFLKGVIEHACNLMELAEESFTKTLYLQPDNIEALTYLALLAERRGDKEKGDLYRQRISRIGGANE